MACDLFTDPVDCLLRPLVELMADSLITDEIAWQNLYNNLIFAPQPPTTSNGLLLWSRPQESQWVNIWEATWVGSGKGFMVGIALAALLVGYKLQQSGQIFGFTAPGRGGQTEPSFKLGLMGIVLAYPIATLALAFTNGVAELLFPTDQFPALMTGLFERTVIDAINFTNPTESFMSLAAVTVSALGLLAWRVMLWAREFLVFIYIWLFPLIMAGRYMGMPVLSPFCSNLLENYAKILLLPLVPAVLAQVYILIWGVEPPSTLLAPMAFTLILVWMSWKLLASGAPFTTSIAKGAAGAGLAAAVLATGGSGFAAANMLRGRYLSGAIYATNPDFDYAPTEEDTKHSGGSGGS